MILQTTPNEWSCLPTAVAMAIGVPLADLLEELGHDGSEVTHPNLDPPACYRGFHPQEMLEFCLRRGTATTMIEKVPCALPKEDKNVNAFTHEDLKMFHPLGEPAVERFDRHLFLSDGWIDCRTRSGLGHAVAYEGGGKHATIFDPNGDTFSYRGPDSAKNHGLTFVNLYRLDEMS